jgi:hypothetical protein
MLILVLACSFLLNSYEFICSIYVISCSYLYKLLWDLVIKFIATYKLQERNEQLNSMFMWVLVKRVHWDAIRV